jgi:hypothetical protein
MSDDLSWGSMIHDVTEKTNHQVINVGLSESDTGYSHGQCNLARAIENSEAPAVNHLKVLGASSQI